jgi:hypothetical protein
MDSADPLYEAIRRDEGDVEAIARHTGWKPAGIARVKQHLFFQAHCLDAYESFGVPPITSRFDSDHAIAESWRRLRAGTYSMLDLQLLRHEAAESWYMRKHGPSYRRAHAAAQKRYPAPAELWS